MDKDFESEDIEGVNKLLRKAKAQAKWEQIALGLGLSSATITDIREKHRRDEKRLYSSLGAWVNGKEEVRATWRILIRTLQSEDVNESALADKIIAEKGFVKRVQKSRMASAMATTEKPIEEKKTSAINSDMKKVPDMIPLSINNLGLLYDLVKEDSPNWYRIGLQLSFKPGELDAIKTIPLANAKGVEGYLMELLHRWLSRTSQLPYLQDLAEAISSADNRRLGAKLVETYLEAAKQTKDVTGEEKSRLEENFRSYNSRRLQHTKEEWPPTLDVEYINLVIIEEKQIVAYTDQQRRKMELTSKGEIQGVLNELPYRNLNLKDITNYSTPSHKVIIIEGAPGVGKTTLAHKLCKDWADSKLLTEFSLLIYIPLRVPGLRVAESVDDVIKCLYKNYPPADLEVMECKQGVGVLFVLDGWDELPQSCRDEDMFFPKLIAGKFLPECSIIVTSRPGVTDDIRCHANRFIEILGFNEDQVKQYIHSYVRQYDKSTNSGEEYADKLIDDLEEYPNVASTCYIAINLTITCFVYCVSGYRLPATLTEVYEHFILHAVKRHLRRVNVTAQIDEAKKVTEFDDKVKAVLTTLGKLAFQGLWNNDLSFNKEQMRKICEDDEIATHYGYGLLKILHVSRKHGPERLFQFLHLTIQEYLAAYSIIQMKEDEQLKTLHAVLREERFGTVLKFFCGMDKFDSCSSRIAFLESYFDTPMVLECIFEGQWEDGCRKVAQHTSSMLSVPHTIQSYHSLVYGYVMAKSGTQWTLKRYCCKISEREVKSFCRYLQPAPRTLCCLHIQKADIVPSAIPHLNQIIRSQIGLRKLLLIEANVNDESLSILSRALHNLTDLEALQLSNNMLTSSSLETVCTLLKQLPSLRILDLSQNKLGEACCKIILADAAIKETLAELHLPIPSKDVLQEIETLNTSRKERGLHELMVHTLK